MSHFLFLFIIIYRLSLSSILSMKKTTTAHILMIFLVIIWGFDYVTAKWGMNELTPTCLMFMKFLIGFVTVGIIKVTKRDWSLVKKRDIPALVACAIFGQILYYECEYNAMTYLPVSLLTILLAFVPAFSVIIERIFLKRKPNRKMIIGIAFCILGIVLVIGADLDTLFQGKIIGYLIAFGAVLSWNIYNFITASLGRYDPITLAFLQILCATVIMSPVAIHNMTPVTEWSGSLIAIILYMGIIDGAIGYMISIYALKNIGPTATSIYSDFLPVSTAIFGALFLHESMTWLQIIGGVVVIAAGFVVIKEKGRLDEVQAVDN